MFQALSDWWYGKPVPEAKSPPKKQLLKKPATDYINVPNFIKLLTGKDQSPKIKKAQIVILIGLIKQGKYPEVLAWKKAHPGSPPLPDFKTLAHSRLLKPFLEKQLGSSVKISDLLSTLSMRNETYVNQLLFNLTKQGHFQPVAEWFVENHNEKSAQSLREKIRAIPVKFHKRWFSVLSQEKGFRAFKAVPVLKPHQSSVKLKGLRTALHPFELLLGEYCRWRVNDQKRTCGVYETLGRLKRALNFSVEHDLINMRQYLLYAHNTRLLQDNDVPDPALQDLYHESLTVNAMNLEPFKTKIRAQVAIYEKKYRAYLACGSESNLYLTEYRLNEQLSHLPLASRDEKKDEKEKPDELFRSMFNILNTALKNMPSSVVYFYYSSVCRYWGQHCALFDVSRRTVVKEGERLSSGLVAKCGRVMATYFDEEKDPEGYGKSRDIFYMKAVYYLALAKQLAPYDANIIENTFYGKGFSDSFLYVENKFKGNALEALEEMYREDFGRFGGYLLPREWTALETQAKNEVEALVPAPETKRMTAC